MWTNMSNLSCENLKAINSVFIFQYIFVPYLWDSPRPCTNRSYFITVKRARFVVVYTHRKEENRLQTWKKNNRVQRTRFVWYGKKTFFYWVRTRTSRKKKTYYDSELLFMYLLSVTSVPVNFLHRLRALSSRSGSSLRNLTDDKCHYYTHAIHVNVLKILSIFYIG